MLLHVKKQLCVMDWFLCSTFPLFSKHSIQHTAFTHTHKHRHANWESVRMRGGNENERKVFQTMLTMNSWEIMALMTKKSKYQETNNLCINKESVSYINMLFFLNKFKKSCANESMLVYIVWLQPCKNYTSPQSIVSVCNKKKKLMHLVSYLHKWD